MGRDHKEEKIRKNKKLARLSLGGLHETWRERMEVCSVVRTGEKACLYGSINIMYVLSLIIKCEIKLTPRNFHDKRISIEM